MDIKRALHLREHAEQQIGDLWSRAEHFGTAHSAMLEERGRINEMLQGTPHWVRSYLDGVWSTHQKYAYRHALVYGAYVGGQFMSTHSSRPDYYQTLGIEPSAFATGGIAKDKGHYWVRPEDGRVRPFFVGD
jgi:hypothetical protein